MNILIINGSHRKNGNTQKFSEYFQNLAIENNINAEIINLVDKDINFCDGCLCCEETGECHLLDNFTEIAETIKKTDVLVFATPCYFNMPTARFKNFIDRTNVLCDFLNNNKKYFCTFIVGQTEIESCLEAYRCIETYTQIMAMEAIFEEPIIAIARNENDLEIDNNIVEQLQTIIKIVKEKM